MPSGKQSTSIRNDVLDALKRWKPQTVSELAAILHEKRGIEARVDELSPLLAELQQEGFVELETLQLQQDALHFIRNLRINGDFWAIVLGTLILGLLILFQGWHTTLLQIALGTLVSVLFPGYAVQMVLFPGSADLQLWQRIILSVGLSLMLVGFYAVILDATPSGIVLSQVFVTLSLHTLLFATFGVSRRYIELIKAQ